MNITSFKEYDATIIASGSEVEIACSVSNKLKEIRMNPLEH